MNPRNATTLQARRFAALGDPTRLSVFTLIARSPLSVAEVAGRLPVSRPAVSQHLKVLSDAHLVTPRAEGTRRIYAVDPQGLAGLRDYLDGFWNRSLAAYARAAEDHHTRQEHR